MQINCESILFSACKVWLLSTIVFQVTHGCPVIMLVTEVGHLHCCCPFSPNLKLEAVRLCGWFSRANPALCNWLCVVSPHRQRASWRPGVRKRGGTCRRGARTDTGMRCNLWRVLFDYRTGTVTPLLSMSVGITWHDSPALTRLFYLNHTSCKYNINSKLIVTQRIDFKRLPSQNFIAQFRFSLCIKYINGVCVYQVVLKAFLLRYETQILSQWFVLEKDHRMLFGKLAAELLIATGQHNTQY